MSGVTIGMELKMWFVRIPFVIIIALLIVFAVNAHNNRKINIKSIEGDVILKRLFYSGNCFSYEDVRSHVGIIDLSKFNDERMKKCLNGDYYIKAELVDLGKIAYNDKELFERNIGFCKFENKFYCYDKEIYALIRDNGILKQDILKMNLVLPMYQKEATGGGLL